ncbi:LysR family transcriptional regulator, partial [Pseudomonas sp. CrR25]|nr:LysR family transcriptional regulator [Pseudomonas sp. CrR25]
AEELALTQSAICRQVASLEEFLNVELFRRSRRGVKLTEAGLSYARRVATQLDAVERDTLAVMGQQGAMTLELAVVPTFGTQWLLPRLQDFQRRHPQVTVNLTNRTRPFLFADTDFDAAIYFGDGDWSGTVSHLLMRENSMPVCSPALLAGQRQLSAEQIAGLPLLQQTTRPYAWRQWFASLGLTVARDLGGPRYELFSMLAQAAMHEMGVALIPPFLIQRELAEGRLVLALEHACRSDKAYYLMIPERKVESAALQNFRDWLVQQAHDYAQASGLE